MKKSVFAVVLALVAILAPANAAQAEGELSASVSIPNVTYTGTSNCMSVPVTLNVSGGVSNGFAYWTTENVTLVGPTSYPTPPGFFFDNEEAPATEMMQMCPWADHAGSYTYSADVTFHNWSDQGGEQFVGHVSATFSLGLARSAIVKLSTHTWQVKIVGKPYLVRSPYVYLQKLRAGKWRTVSRSTGSSAGKFTLRSRPAGKYRLVYRGNADLGLSGSTSKVFRRP